MNQSPREALTRIIAQHGSAICEQPKRVEGLLRDYCGAYRREINIIKGALEEGVAADLLRAGKSGVPREALLGRLTGRLQEHLAYTPEAARWAVDTWAVALGVLSDAELRAREQRIRDEEQRVRDEQAREQQRQQQQYQQSRTNQNQPPKDIASDANNRTSTNQPSGGSGRANNQSSHTQTTAPVNRATPPSLPPTRQQTQPPPQTQPPLQRAAPPVQQPTQPLVTTRSNSNQTSPLTSAPPPRPRHTVRTRIFPLTNVPRVPPPVAQPSPQIVQTQAPQDPPRKRRGRKLVGCFFVFVLIIVLFIGAVVAVPWVINLLQEEQSRPSINEPRINRY